MKREHILQILYELALVTGGETRVQPLLTKTLQRMLYHTAFPCGIFFSAVTLLNKGDDKSAANLVRGRIDKVIGNRALMQKQGNSTILPYELLRGKAGFFEDKALLDTLFDSESRYKVGLRLPVGENDMMLLLAESEPKSKINYELVFEPILRNLSKTLGLCRDAEMHTEKLEKEIDSRAVLEESLRDSRNLLETVLDTVPVRIFWKDRECRYLGSNRAFAVDAGFETGDQLVGLMDEELPWTPDESAACRIGDLDVMNTAIPKLGFEEMLTTSSGESIWLHTSKMPIMGSDGKAIGVLGCYEDITERKESELHIKESELRYRTVFETTVDGIININDKGIIESANSAIEKIFGYSPGELLGSNIAMLMSDDDASTHDRYVQSYEDKAKPTLLGFERELSGLRKSGELFPIEISLNQMLIHGRRHFTGVIRDISDRKAIERNIMLAKNEAETSSRAKSEFLSNMSHELRTPMNAVLGFGQVLQMEEGLSEIQSSSVEEIMMAGNHLLELINEVLDLSKIEAGRLELSIESLSYDEIITECMALIMPLAKQRFIDISYAEGEKGIRLKGDRMRFKQVLINLTSNAIKYNCEHGKVTIGIESIENGYWRVYVRDTGAGISDEHLDKVFEPFNRLEFGSSNIEGTGIGLAISRKLIESMQGSIGVESQQGQGSTFWIDIPAYE